VNGDGIPDLIVADSAQSGGTPRVSVLQGNGDGRFQAPRYLAAGSFVTALALGDFNGDGIPDLAVANESGGSVSVLLGNGDDTFQAPVSYTVGNAPVSVAAGDFNGDGLPDLAVANMNGVSVSVLFGNGDGTFQPARNITIGGPSSVTAGDFNGDGIADLAVINGAGEDARLDPPSSPTPAWSAPKGSRPDPFYTGDVGLPRREADHPRRGDRRCSLPYSRCCSIRRAASAASPWMTASAMPPCSS
jgi:hypothetical protein